MLVSKIFTPLLGLAAFTDRKKHGIRPHRCEIFFSETSSGTITREPRTLNLSTYFYVLHLIPQLLAHFPGKSQYIAFIHSCDLSVFDDDPALADHGCHMAGVQAVDKVS